MRTIVVLIGISFISVVGCSRHVVAERSAGRIDTARSVATYGDTAWRIDHEPSAAPAMPDEAATRERQEEAP